MLSVRSFLLISGFCLGLMASPAKVAASDSTCAKRLEARDLNKMAGGFVYTNRPLLPNKWEEHQQAVFTAFFDDPFLEKLLFPDSDSAVAFLKKTRAKVLDIGCGQGQAVLDLRDLGIDAFGIDARSGFWTWEDWTLMKRQYLLAPYKTWAQNHPETATFSYELTQTGIESWRSDMEKVLKWEALEKKKGGKAVLSSLTESDDRTLWNFWKAFKSTIPKAYFSSGPERVEGDPFTAGDAYHMKYPDNSFDFIYSYLSIFNQIIYRTDGSLAAAVQEMLRVLKPGGIFVTEGWTPQLVKQIRKAFPNVEVISDERGSEVVIKKPGVSGGEKNQK